MKEAGQHQDGPWERFEDRCRLRRLPRSIRRQLRHVRNSYQRGEPLRVVEQRIAEIAKREGLLRRTADTGLRERDYVPAIHLRQIHRQLLRDRAFVTHMGNEIKSALQDGNRDRRLPPYDYPSALPDCRPPSRGVWFVRSDLGFGLSTQFEGKPEGFAVGIAQRAWERKFATTVGTGDLGLTEEGSLTVLDWGSFGGMTTHSLVSARPSCFSLGVYEQDVIGEVTESPYALPLNDLSDEQRFDLIVVTVPPPGRGGMYQYRNRYKNAEQRHAIDMGTMGPTRWAKRLRYLVTDLPPLLADSGEIVLLVPESVRVDGNYESAPRLLEGLSGLLVEQGLVVTHDVPVVETPPRAQPFVGTNRPARRCIIAGRPATWNESTGEGCSS